MGGGLVAGDNFVGAGDLFPAFEGDIGGMTGGVFEEAFAGEWFVLAAGGEPEALGDGVVGGFSQIKGQGELGGDDRKFAEVGASGGPSFSGVTAAIEVLFGFFDVWGVGAAPAGEECETELVAG